jgi:regulator of replication initiation timing
MGDNAPDPGYAIQKLRAQRASLVATRERQKLENMDLRKRIADNETNMAATDDALTEIETTLAALIEEHGENDG